MDIGKMRHRISVYNTTSAQAAGGMTQTRTKLFDSWAFVQPLNQARAFAYGITENFRSYEITIRYRSTITTKCTIDWNSKVLTIQSLLNTNTDLKEIKIIAVEND